LASTEYAAALEVLGLFETFALKDPQMAGEPHPSLATVWVFQTPPTLARLPQVAIVYTIEEVQGFVTLWNVYRLA
jgi:hypothetical protein